MKIVSKYLAAFCAFFLLSPAAKAQNWVLTIQDTAYGTPVNQVNGVTGGTATLYGSLLNFTGTSVSNDGTGNPAPATLLDFAGLGFTRNPGQDNLESLFTPDPSTGFPQVAGSADGVSAGSTGYLPLGTFNLSGLAPGIYHEDFTAGAFPDDINSMVPFDNIHGTLTLNVTPPAAVPETSTATLLGSGLVGLGLLVLRRRARRA